MLNALSQVVLKTASPGVPDFYQGTELWDLNLVDPDNRRPIDFEHRRQALAEAQAVAALPCAQRREAITRLLDQSFDGTIKMFVTMAGLELRKSAEELFLDGDYVPLDVEVSVPGHVVALARVDRRTNADRGRPSADVEADGRRARASTWRALEDIACRHPTAPGSTGIARCLHRSGGAA